MTTSPSAQPARRILIVEDNALVAKFFRLALERAGGFSCLVSEDVPLLLEEVKAGRADLVLLDISLSEAEWQGQPIGGIALCRLLKAHSSRHLPVVLATAHVMRGDQDRLLRESGADGFLEKPVFEVDLLIAKVRSLLPSTESPNPQGN